MLEYNVPVNDLLVRDDGMDKETKGMLDLILNKLNAMETRQDEIYQVVKAIEHTNQVHKAEIDSLNIRVSHAEGTLSAVGDAFNKRKVV